MPRNNRKGRSAQRSFCSRNKRTRSDRSGAIAAKVRRRVAAKIRIIGGEWRGRKLHFPHSPTLRPTPDRVRETLFNWLQFEIAGSRCLDLFAGSGALGFEALSRGATRGRVRRARSGVSRRSASDSTRCECSSARAADSDVATPSITSRGRRPRRSMSCFSILPTPSAGSCSACEALERGGWLQAGLVDLPRGRGLARQSRGARRVDDRAEQERRRRGLSSGPARRPRDANEDAERRGSA